MWLHKNGQADRKNSSHSCKCLCEFTTVRLREKNESYFEFSNYSVLVCDVLVVVISTFSSEQAETVQPVLKVVKLTLQFLWVHLIGPKNTSKNIFFNIFAFDCGDCPAPSAPPALASSSLPALPSSSSPSCLCLFCCLSLESHQFWFLSTGLWRWGGGGGGRAENSRHESHMKVAKSSSNSVQQAPHWSVYYSDIHFSGGTWILGGGAGSSLSTTGWILPS